MGCMGTSVDVGMWGRVCVDVGVDWGGGGYVDLYCM